MRAARKRGASWHLLGCAVLTGVCALVAATACGPDPLEPGCEPDCQGRGCGLDPVCGTLDCGACPTGSTCSADGVCVPGCEPDCRGRACGLDSVCGTFDCGACPAGSTCSAEGACQLPVCECFVQEAWCGAGAGQRAAELGCRIPLLPEHADDILHCPGGAWSVKQECAEGCVQAAAGTPDTCRETCGCLLGEGPYCAARARAEAEAAGCTLELATQHADDLLRCEDGAWSVLEPCAQGCAHDPGSTQLDDACELPACECFVQVAWCGSGAGKKAEELGCQIPLLPEHNGDILYCPDGIWSVKEACELGCIEAPEGTPDTCRDNSEYRLPWSCGDTYRCTSGNHTSNHDGKDEYAYDFGMPVGTTLRAMRPGTVLRVRRVSAPGDDCYDGGGSSCANYANTVEVRHADGTVALYMHLSTISVSAGEHIERGEVLGHSGNSGWSTGPHLHVQVQRDCGIWWCQSIPLRFEEGAITTGAWATSGNCG